MPTLKLPNSFKFTTLPRRYVAALTLRVVMNHAESSPNRELKCMHGMLYRNSVN